MWGPDNRIYFISDRDGRMNLFSTDLTGKDTKQLTTFKDFDIKFPSIGKDSIVFEQAGYIWRFDLAKGQAVPVPIDIKEDLASGRSAFIDASKNIQSVSTAPDAQRVIAVARGDLFSVPMKDGTARNLTRTSNVHERDAVWSPDGKWIAYNSDATGENELYVRSQDGKGQPQQITSNADTYYYQAIWSPDSKKLLWSDRLQRLRYVDVASKAITQVDQDKEGEIRRLRLVAGQPMDRLGAPRGKRRQQSLSFLHRRQEDDGGDRRLVFGRAIPLSATTENISCSRRAAISSHSSARPISPTFIATSSAFISLRSARETESPLGPRSDEVGKKKDKDKEKEGDKKEADKKEVGEKKADDKKADDKKGGDAKDKEKDAKKPVVVKVDLDGIQDRLVALEIPPGNYTHLRLVDNRIFYLRRTVADDQAGDDDNPRQSEIAPLRLQPGGPERDRAGRRQHLRDHRRRQEDAGQDQEGLRHHRSSEGQARDQGP